MTSGANHVIGEAGKRDHLWMLVVSPAVWAAHFLACYVTAAILCGRIGGPGGSFPTVRWAIAGYTVVALIAVAVTGYAAYRRHTFGDAEAPHDDDSPEDRYRFLGLATLLLSGISAIAVVYAALAAVVIEACW
jgi:hypothetical protein